MIKCRDGNGGDEDGKLEMIGEKVMIEEMKMKDYKMHS